MSKKNFRAQESVHSVHLGVDGVGVGVGGDADDVVGISDGRGMSGEE